VAQAFSFVTTHSLSQSRPSRMISVGRRSSGNTANQRLTDGGQKDNTAETLDSVSESNMPHNNCLSVASVTDRVVTIGNRVFGKKEGEWIKETDDWDDSAPRRVPSARSHASVRSQASLRSVGSVKSTASQDVIADMQSTWICSAVRGVAYYCEPSFEAETMGVCEHGEKVNAVKQGDWLMVIEVKKSVNVEGAFGLRSMRSFSRQTSVEDGRFLPFIGPGGERLFKNERVQAWEKIKAKQTSSPELTKKANCALM